MEKNLRKLLLISVIIAAALLLRFGVEAAFTFLDARFDLTQVATYIVRSLLAIITILIFLSVALRSENPSQKLPWLLILTFEPIIGITLFLTFGRSFKNSRRYKNRPLMHDDSYITQEQRSSEGNVDLKTDNELYNTVFHAAHKISYHQPFVNNTEITVFKNGEKFYPELKESIKNAKKFILFEFYLVRSDTRGKEILNLLMQRADEGLDVKVIVDSLGITRMSWRYLKKLKQSALDFVINDRIYFPFFNTRINFRNHRKIVVIDGEIGYTGGMNIANEYDNTIDYKFYFRDTQVKLEGAAVKSLTAIFFKDYYYNTNTFINDDTYYPEVTKQSSTITQVLQSGPDSHEAHIRNTYQKMFLTAKKKIRIMTPYMAIDSETLNALIIAKRSGVDVEIIIPGKPDKRLVYKVTKFYASVLLEHGIDVYIYKKGFCHAKIVVIDDEIASVGSYNLDNRSAVIDFEVTALFTGEQVQEVLEHYFQDKSDSEKIDLEAWKKRSIITRFTEGLLSIFTLII